MYLKCSHCINNRSESVLHNEINYEKTEIWLDNTSTFVSKHRINIFGEIFKCSSSCCKKEPAEYENHFQNMLTFFFEVHPPKTYSSNSTFSPNLVYCVLKEWIRISSIVHAKIDGNPVGGLRTL